MSGPDTQLAVLLRKAEWMLDDAAHALGDGRLSSSDRDALAQALGELAGALRDHSGEKGTQIAGTPGDEQLATLDAPQ